MKDPKDIKVLIACEESQAVCIEFRKLGFTAFSCDILDCSGGHPEWHIKEDVLNVIDREHWDCMIAHPPCTRLTVTANKWYKPEYADRFPNIHKEREEAVEFFMKFINCNIPHYAIENPIGIMSTRYRKADQIIQPYYFGDKSRKATCLWIRKLPKLIYCKEDNLFETTTIVTPDIYYFKNGKGTCSYDYMYALKAGEDRAKLRSKTYPGIAKAMATQWGEYLLR